MLEAYFGFKKTPFSDSPDAKQLFASQAWNQVKARLQFLVDHHGAGLLTGEIGAGKSTAARTFSAGLNPNLYKILYLHWTSGSALDLLRQIALELGLEPAHYRGDLVRQISEAIVHLNKSKKQHPILICDEAQLLRHPALEGPTDRRGHLAGPGSDQHAGLGSGAGRAGRGGEARGEVRRVAARLPRQGRGLQAPRAAEAVPVGRHAPPPRRVRRGCRTWC